ncbi:MAG: sigma-70 family RNA polymerase sigma factor [Myxococcota bacterium]
MPRLSESGRAELDDTTLARARRGEQAACARFVAVYERRVFAAIGRIAGARFGQARVEELAQDAFLRALRALPRFSPQGPAKLSTWVLTIATRVALNELRRAKPPAAPLDEAVASPAPDEHARFDARRTVRAAVEALTPEQRAVLVLHDLHGLTDSEVAHALDLQVPAVKSRLVRARARLRKALTEQDDG